MVQTSEGQCASCCQILWRSIWPLPSFGILHRFFKRVAVHLYRLKEPILHSFRGSWSSFSVITTQKLNRSGWNLEYVCIQTKNWGKTPKRVLFYFCHETNMAFWPLILHQFWPFFKQKIWIGVCMHTLVKNFQISPQGFSMPEKQLKR